MKRIVPIVAACAAACVAATGAFAQSSVPNEIKGYKSISVAYSEKAAACNLEHSEAYSDRLREKLAAIGVTQSDQSVLNANLGVTGRKFGLTRNQCVSAVELGFVTILRKENVVTDNPTVRRTIDRLEAFPIVLYKAGMLGVQPQGTTSTTRKSTASKEATLKMIDELVKGLESKRM